MTFQKRVQKWMHACFGEVVSADRLERGDRYLEETLELLQSVGYPRERILALEEYVYARPIGEPHQEAGGVMLTLAAFCEPHGLDMTKAGEDELFRCWGKIEKIREKQARKPTGSALPIAADPPPPESQLEGETHPDDLAVDRFASAMKAKLTQKRDEGRSGWEDKDDCSQLFLSQLLREHVEKGGPVDVGNLAMMLHQREERISSLLETLQGE